MKHSSKDAKTDKYFHYKNYKTNQNKNVRIKMSEQKNQTKEKVKY